MVKTGLTTQEIQMKETWKETTIITGNKTINRITNKTTNKITNKTMSKTQIKTKTLTEQEIPTTTTQEIITMSANIPIKIYKKVLFGGPFLIFKNNI